MSGLNRGASTDTDTETNEMIVLERGVSTDTDNETANATRVLNRGASTDTDTETANETSALKKPAKDQGTRNGDNFLRRWCGWLVKWWDGLPRGVRIAIIIIGAILLISLVIVVVVKYLPSSSAAKQTPIQKLAAYYEKSLDRTLQPCDNFYKFACTNLRREYAKENKDRFDTMAMMTKSARLPLDDLLTKPPNASDSAILKQLKTFRQMCSNTTKADAEGIEPVLALLRQIGGWPLLSNEWEDTRGWVEIVGRFNQAGFLSMFPFHLDSRLSLAPLFDDRHPRVLPDGNRTVEYVKRVALLLNSSNDEIDVDIKDCIVFESELYEIANSVEKDDKDYTLERLMGYYPKMAWEAFFRGVFLTTGTKTSSDMSLYFTHSKYIPKVSELLARTPAKTIRNYMVWRLIEQAIPVMPAKFREAKEVFEQRAVGQPKNLDCVDILIERAELSTGYAYIQNFFDESMLNTSQSIMQSVRNQVDLFLNNVTSWMDKGTRNKMLESMKRLRMTLPRANPSIAVMERLKFESNATMFANYRRLASAQRDSKYGRFGLSPEEDDQLIPLQYAMEADSFYVHDVNTIYILATMLQRPAFSVDQPMYLNYGGIGFVMAHEMTHALKILSACNGICPSHDAFQNRTECMEELYDVYVLKQIKETVDGKKTAEENIGDMIGLQFAYRAYEQYMNGSEESGLPGFDYTPRQWFWINVATFFCSSDTDAGLRKYMADEVHSPAEARVNVALANTEQFSIDFACSNTTQMNPAYRCKF